MSNELLPTDKHELYVLKRIALISSIFAQNEEKELSDIIIAIAEQVVMWEAEAFDMGYKISEEEPIFQPSTAESVKQSLGLVLHKPHQGTVPEK